MFGTVWRHHFGATGVCQTPKNLDPSFLTKIAAVGWHPKPRTGFSVTTDEDEEQDEGSENYLILFTRLDFFAKCGSCFESFLVQAIVPGPWRQTIALWGHLAQNQLGVSADRPWEDVSIEEPSPVVFR